MIIRYRHFLGLVRRGSIAVALDKLGEKELDERWTETFAVISKELLRSHRQKAQTAIRHMLSLLLPIPIYPFHSDTPLGPEGIRSYFHFRRWLKWKLAE
jgi:hypothetical protein